MSMFSDLTPEQAKQAKDCKNPDELKEVLESCKALSKEELSEAAGGYSDTEGEANDDYTEDKPVRVSVRGDNCRDVKAENVSRDFATGRITGADFFA